MSPMRLNLSDLSRMQRQWSALMTNTEVDSARLTEVDSFGSNPGDLRMLTYTPPSLPPDAPLVVVLHGCSQTAAAYDSGTGWSVLAERHGFAVLLPEQRRQNNAHGCFNWFEPGDVTRNEGEVASISQMIAKCVADHGLNARRVYITGLSAGGAMTAAMLANYPEVFAAGAIVAGVPFGAAHGVQQAIAAMHNCRSHTGTEWGDHVRAASPARLPAEQPRIAIWHGDADQTVTPGNALESAKQWANVHGLLETDGVEDRVDGVPHRIWRDRDGTTKVELYAVPGLAHGTPITPHADGDAGVGRAMPFVLDAPISSTWRMAQTWGLLSPVTAELAQPVEPAPTDPLSLIARGLRAAGLLGKA